MRWRKPPKQGGFCFSVCHPNLHRLVRGPILARHSQLVHGIEWVEGVRLARKMPTTLFRMAFEWGLKHAGSSELALPCSSSPPPRRWSRGCPGTAPGTWKWPPCGWPASRTFGTRHTAGTRPTRKLPVKDKQPTFKGCVIWWSNEAWIV